MDLNDFIFGTLGSLYAGPMDLEIPIFAHVILMQTHPEIINTFNFNSLIERIIFICDYEIKAFAHMLNRIKPTKSNRYIELNYFVRYEAIGIFTGVCANFINKLALTLTHNEAIDMLKTPQCRSFGIEFYMNLFCLLLESITFSNPTFEKDFLLRGSFRNIQLKAHELFHSFSLSHPHTLPSLIPSQIELGPVTEICVPNHKEDILHFYLNRDKVTCMYDMLVGTLDNAKDKAKATSSFWVRNDVTPINWFLGIEPTNTPDYQNYRLDVNMFSLSTSVNDYSVVVNSFVNEISFSPREKYENIPHIFDFKHTFQLRNDKSSKEIQGLKIYRKQLFEKVPFNSQMVNCEVTLMFEHRKVVDANEFRIYLVGVGLKLTLPAPIFIKDISWEINNNFEKNMEYFSKWVSPYSLFNIENGWSYQYKRTIQSNRNSHVL